VREVEAFRAESAPGASYEEPAADGSRPGVFYVNTFNLKAQPIFGMETLSLHEASPGHHFQISIAQEDQNLPKFRRFGSHYTAYVEGWALYAESLGKELGLFTDPYQWYGRLSDEQLRAMRLVVDTGLHAKGWSREQAIRYMLDNSSMAESDIVSEVERYIVWPGQALGYKIGQLEISRLRREAEGQLGDQVRHQGLPSRRADRGPGAAAGAGPAGAGLGGGAPRGPQRRLTVCAARATVCRKPLVTRAPAPRLAPSTSTRSTR
jgi:uncharacterized protein (DUF885 family)